MKTQRSITLGKDLQINDNGTLPSNWDDTEGPCVLWLTTDDYGEIEVPIDAIVNAEILGASTDIQ